MVPTEELISIDESNVPRRTVSNGKAKRGNSMFNPIFSVQKEDIIPNTVSMNKVIKSIYRYSFQIKTFGKRHRV